RVSHESMLMSCDYFEQQHACGRITSADLSEAIAQAKANTSPAQLVSWLNNPQLPESEFVFCLADIVEAGEHGPWNRVIAEQISKWCAAYFDEAQSAWRMPWKKLPLFAAWKQAASIDLAPELTGLPGFRSLVASLPDAAAEVIPVLLESLQITENAAEDYMHRLLMTLPGWSSYVQYRVRDKSMHGTHDESLLDLLAVRLVFESALLKIHDSRSLREFWSGNQCADPVAPSESTRNLLLWHSALEIGFQRELCGKLIANATSSQTSKNSRPLLQAVFCIDVRSEVMRRSLESVTSEVETLGFAGFFGMPIEHVPFGQRKGVSQVPVLFTPKYRVREHLPDATPSQEKSKLRTMQLGRRLNHSWNAFKTSAVSCFSFVEAAGPGFAWKLVKDGFQIGTQGEAHSCSSCAEPNLHHHKKHSHDIIDDTHPESGIPPEDQVQLALGALKNMGLTSRFAPLVMICGHGSNTTNNPYAAGLDCGACGGHAGDSNARVAAAILNQPAVRAGLVEHGIHIPDDTHFIAALHDTTTDEITLFDTRYVPTSHKRDFKQVRQWIAEATLIARSHRAPTLGLGHLTGAQLGAGIQQKSADWSEVRPEWGLAGNAAFIAAPRDRTKGLNLGGRVFLHNYNHDADTTKSTLELIMTAPMVVANWINMQYYASTVNNRLWGSGNKVTHNVVGTFGIQQGNGGDLQAGLPLQSVHDGEKWMHEPVRLSVFIEANHADIDAVIAKHESVRQLVDNGWVHLFAIEDEGQTILRHLPGGGWESVTA
ncbi:DUF2309 domain-containing protein, partial [Prosthecobacter sp.]|uniref:YbcC family protein n=1 Tax=Prosthecobacter sp. TaxID=1965333 RepID=UPI001D46DC15